MNSDYTTSKLESITSLTDDLLQPTTQNEQRGVLVIQVDVYTQHLSSVNFTTTPDFQSMDGVRARIVFLGIIARDQSMEFAHYEITT